MRALGILQSRAGHGAPSRFAPAIARGGPHARGGHHQGKHHGLPVRVSKIWRGERFLRILASSRSHLTGSSGKNMGQPFSKYEVGDFYDEMFQAPGEARPHYRMLL